ncbi:hypothetical protein JYU34_019657 [Plutella xylostella]|uniref:Uncharacterized protein n=1 Tax=Plutella xylostella TaxID=51655 RepID=A0ABQ7PXD4_PLUXY|nr:hypothetical protein JYU34_019657 [Plutella xylostella]
MSQKSTRKSAAIDDKEKNAENPVKDMKKKVAANAEKEKMAAEKQNGDKHTDKRDKQNGDKKPADKKTTEKAADKSIDKKTADKNGEKCSGDKHVEKKSDKPADKKPADKPTEKADKPAEKPADKKEDKVKESNSKGEASPKPQTPQPAPHQNGSSTNGSQHNGGALLVKPTRTPETPRPRERRDADDDTHPKETKLLKLREDAPAPAAAPDRILRSTESPRSAEKSEGDGKKSEGDGKKSEGEKKDLEAVIVLEDCESSQAESRKPDTNFSKSRVKVSPYRRSSRIADTTASSLQANYTGNNTTMEMDITETSFSSTSEAGPQASNSPYIVGLRTVRGRQSYKVLGEMPQPRPRVIKTDTSSSRPTGTVVGRKRKPDPAPAPAAEGAGNAGVAGDAGGAGGKRRRLLARLVPPFLMSSASPLPSRRAAPIVGINTDLPMSAPLAAPLDPESLKTAPAPLAAPSAPEVAAPATPSEDRVDSKRCIVITHGASAAVPACSGSPAPAGPDRGAPGGPGDPAVDGATRPRHRMSGSARRRLYRRRMREEAARLAAVPLADIAARVTPSSAAAGRSNEYDRGSATVTRGHTGGPMPAGGPPLPTPARPIPASSTATQKAPTSVAHPGVSQKGCLRLVPGGGQPKTPANTSARVKRMRSDKKVSPAAGGTRGPPKRACLARPKAPQSASLNYAGALKAHLSAVIVAADWRELSPDQMTIIRRAVELKHSEAVNDLTRDVVPAFDHFPQQLVRGGLKLWCCDDYTLDWLKETVSSLPPLWDGGCQLKVVAAWRLFSSDIREVEGVRCALLIGIPQPEVERLELKERKLSYKVGTVRVRCHLSPATNPPGTLVNVGLNVRDDVPLSSAAVMRAAWLALMACAAAAAAASEETAGGAGAPGYLLPGDVRPSHYDVMLAFDVNATNKFPFFGVVSILVSLLLVWLYDLYVIERRYTIPTNVLRKVGGSLAMHL